MMFDISNKDIVVALGLLILWIGGMTVSSFMSIEYIGYNMQNGYRYICKECGMLVPDHHYHGMTECKGYNKTRPFKPNHKLYSGSEEYQKAPDWHFTLEEQRQ